MSIMALQKDKNGNIIPIGTYKNGITLDGTSSAISSDVFDINGATDVRIVAVTSCYFLSGITPTATSSIGSYIPESTIVDLRIEKGHKISVYGGKLNITPYGGEI